MRNRLHRKCSNQARLFWLLRPILWGTGFTENVPTKHDFFDNFRLYYEEQASQKMFQPSMTFLINSAYTMRNRLHRKCSNQAWFFWLLRPILGGTGFTENVPTKHDFYDYFGLYYEEQASQKMFQPSMIFLINSAYTMRNRLHRKLSNQAWFLGLLRPIPWGTGFTENVPTKHDFFDYFGLYYEEQASQKMFQPSMIFLITSAYTKRNRLHRKCSNKAWLFWLIRPILWGTGFTEYVPTKHDFYDFFGLYYEEKASQKIIQPSMIFLITSAYTMRNRLHRKCSNQAWFFW
jgi:hypothetical protein